MSGQFTITSIRGLTGSDTKAVLAEAGYSATEIDNLIASGIALTEIKKA